MGFRISFFALFRCCEKGKSKPDFLHLTTADWPLSWGEKFLRLWLTGERMHAILTVLDVIVQMVKTNSSPFRDLPLLRLFDMRGRETHRSTRCMR